MVTVIARALAVVMALSALWAAWLIGVGGFDLRIASLEITSYEPLRPLLIGSVAWAIYTALTGADAMRRRLSSWLARTSSTVIALALAVAMTMVAGAYSVTAATVSDTYGYVSEADLWIAGNLRLPQPWVVDAPWPEPHWSFTPLAYRPLDRGGVNEIVPIVSPGLPLLLAAAKIVGGQELLFWIVPLFAGMLVLATYGIGVRLGSPTAGLVAAWLLATSPTVLFMSTAAMTDVPAAAAWAGAVYFALGRGVVGAVASGLSVALAVLIRPNLVPLAAVIPLWFAIERAGGRWRARAIRIAAFGVVSAIGPMVIALVYGWLYESPFVSGYGSLEGMFGLHNVPTNLRNYLAWFAGTQTVFAVAGIVAVAVPIRAVWPWVRDRRALLMGLVICSFITVQYLTYLPFDTWWFLRFFLPCWPFVMLGSAAVALPALQSPRPWVALAAGWFVVALGANCFHEAYQRGTFAAWHGERRYVEIAREVRTRTPANSVVYTELHSGSMRYYGGRLTVRFDLLHPEWLDRSAEWFASRGTRAYLLLDEWEIDPFKKRFAGQRLASELDSRLTLVYNGPSILRLYDLTSAAVGPPTAITGSDMRALRSAPPVPEAFSLALPR